MRKALSLFILLALTMCAEAEPVFTGDGDIYYHAIPDCMGREYDEASDDNGLYPCPVCVQDERDYPGLEVFQIAGLTIIRMPDDWMAAQTDTSGIFAMTEEEEYTGEEAEARVAEYLHGDAYADFKRGIREGGTSESIARIMSNYTLNCDRCQTVHLGGAWYDVYGNMEYPSPYDHDLNFRFFFGPMFQTGAVLKEHISDEYDDYFTEGFQDPPLTVPEAVPTWSTNIEGGELNLYTTHGFHLMVFRLTGKDALLMPRLTLDGPGWPEKVEVLAADVDGDALYGAVLSQGQAEALRQGRARLSWKRFEDFQRDWEDVPYSVVETEQEYGDWLVVDRDGRSLLRSDGRIDRDGDVFLTDDDMPRSAYETIGFVREDGWYDPKFQSCTLYNAAQGTTLLRGEYLFHRADSRAHGFDYNTWLDVSVYAEGASEPLATLESDDGSVPLSYWTDSPNPVTRFTVSRDAAVYLGSFDDPLPDIPDGCFAFRLTSGFSDRAHDLRSVVIVWSLDGKETPTAEIAGCIGEQWKQVQ